MVKCASKPCEEPLYFHSSVLNEPWSEIEVERVLSQLD